MKSLTNAKRSAEHHAPEGAILIKIRDLMDQMLSRITLDDSLVDSCED
ncbi:hypothetical protein QPP80_003793 [Vibrio alginolyticus]|nr:hypothetical protein [Vibrio alginolyticus]